MNRTYHYPDGTTTDIRPSDGDICKALSPKKGKAMYYEWFDDEGDWYVLPDDFTNPEVIEKSKEIMKIGKFYSLRPKKKYTYWTSSDEYDMYPFACSPIGPVHRAEPTGALPYGIRYPEQRDVLPIASVSEHHGLTPVCSVTEQYKSIIGTFRDKHHRRMRSVSPTSSSGTAFVDCECGALYTHSIDRHYEWCPRYGKNDS
jgi:hypothetical protein